MDIVLFLLLSLATALLLTALVPLLYAGILLAARPLGRLWEQRSQEPDFCPPDAIPERLIRLFLLAEDQDFYTHKGFLINSIRSAFRINRRAGRIVLGGSTITQQLMKNLYFHFRKSYLRKATELLLALHAERVLGKERILAMYLNCIYFGNGIYGISDAARFYFGRSVRELTPNQMLMLAVIPAAPTCANPIQHAQNFRKRRDAMLDRLNRNPGDPPVLTPEEIRQIRSYDASRLDPGLREPDSFTRSYPQDIVMINERFGPFRTRQKHPFSGRRQSYELAADTRKHPVRIPTDEGIS